MDCIKIKLDAGAYMPERAHKADAGYDLKSRENVAILAHDSYTFDTGVHIAIPEGYVGFLKSKSGLNLKFDLSGEGVIDSGYTGSIKVKLYNGGRFPMGIDKGQKIIQLVLLPIFTPDLIEVDDLDETERGNNGFGSTGK